jgi:hypothetical protein
VQPSAGAHFLLQAVGQSTPPRHAAVGSQATEHEQAWTQSTLPVHELFPHFTLHQPLPQMSGTGAPDWLRQAFPDGGSQSM